MSSLPRGLVYCGEKKKKKTRKSEKAKSKSNKVTREGWGEVIIVSSIMIAGCHVGPGTMNEAKRKNVRKSTPTLFNVLKDTGRIGKRIVTAMRQSHVPHP